MKNEVLPEKTKALFQKFRNEDLPPKSYLGGGTAIALHLGHRQSVDLDWFTQSEFNEKLWQMRWETKWNFNMQGRDWQTLVGEIAGVKTSLFFYKYPLIGDLTLYNGLQIASLKDLAAMKVDAVTSRGTKRDFIDLYFLTKEYGPDLMLDFYDQKYGNLEERELLIRKALVYFKEADGDEMPHMLALVDWEKVKSFFLRTFV